MSLVNKNLVALSDGGGGTKKTTTTTKQPNSRIGATGRTRIVAPGSASVAVDKTQPVAPTTRNGITYTTAAGRAVVSPVTVAQNIAGAQQVAAAKAAAAAAQPVATNTQGGGSSGPSAAQLAAQKAAQAAAARLQELEGARPTYAQSQTVQDLLGALQRQEAARPGEYTPSDAATAALAQLTAQEGNKPTYTNGYADQISDMLGRILNREPFQYDFNADPMYQVYAQKYREQGRQAMRDTMGNAAALTGGFGNSYAQQVGQQAYQQNLSNLNDAIPQLRDAAYQMYQDQGNELRNNMALLRDMEGTDYARYRDDVSDYYSDLDYFQSKYHMLSDEDYQRYKDNISLWQQDRDYLYSRYADESDREYSRYRDTVGDWQTDRDYWNDKAMYEAAQAAAAAKSSGGGGGIGKKATVDYATLNKQADSYGLDYPAIIDALSSGSITQMQADVLGRKVENQYKELYATPQVQQKLTEKILGKAKKKK